MSPIDRKEPTLGRPSAAPHSPAQKIHARKQDAPNVRPLGEVGAEKIQRLFNQQVKMPPPLGAPKDPSPSKTIYRLQRVWLTPSYWTGLKFGLPLLIIAALLGYGFMNPVMRDRVQAMIGTVQNALYSHPEFQIHLLKIDGVGMGLANDIRSHLDLKLPISSLELRLSNLKAQVERLDAVANADLYINDNNVLELDVTPRIPVVLWRKGRALELLDINGVRAGVVQSRLQRRDLPVIVGAAAEDHIAQAVQVFQLLAPMQQRVRGLRRVGQRRWDIILDRQQIIQLPEVDPIVALRQFLILNSAQNILERDILRVDIRDPNRLFVQVSPYAKQRLRTQNDSDET